MNIGQCILENIYSIILKKAIEAEPEELQCLFDLGMNIDCIESDEYATLKSYAHALHSTVLEWTEKYFHCHSINSDKSLPHITAEEILIYLEGINS